MSDSLPRILWFERLDDGHTLRAVLVQHAQHARIVVQRNRDQILHAEKFKAISEAEQRGWEIYFQLVPEPIRESNFQTFVKADLIPHAHQAH